MDLLRPMSARRGRYDAYFFPCDYHWDSEGNRVAAELVLEALEGTLYGPGGALTASEVETGR